MSYGATPVRATDRTALLPVQIFVVPLNTAVGLAFTVIEVVAAL
jgi:hypothetical protein